MAEQFEGRRCHVSISDGGAEAMIQAWVRIGERLQPSPAFDSVLTFLRSRLTECYDGGRAFSIDPPVPALDSEDKLRTLGSLIDVLSQELAKTCPDPGIIDIRWSHALRLWWIAKVLNLYQLVNDALPPGARPLPDPNLDLSPDDRARVELERLLGLMGQHRWRRYWDRNSPPISDQLAVLERIIELTERLGAQPDHLPISELHYLRSQLLRECGDTQSELQALREAAALAGDTRDRAVLEEMVAESERLLNNAALRPGAGDTTSTQGTNSSPFRSK